MKTTLTFSGTLVVILIFLSGCEPNLIKVVKNGNINSTRELVSKGSDVNARNKDGYTVLTVASWYGHKEIVELLIESGADVNARDTEGSRTALLGASLSGQKEIAEKLIKSGADVNAKFKDGRTVLGYTDSEDIIELLKAHGAKR